MTEEAAAPASTVRIGVVRWAGAPMGGQQLSAAFDAGSRPEHLPDGGLQTPTRMLSFPTASRALQNTVNEQLADTDAPSPSAGSVRWAGEASSPSAGQQQAAAPRLVQAPTQRYGWMRTDTPLK